MSNQLHSHRDEDGERHYVDLEEQASDSVLDDPEFLLMLAESGDEASEDDSLTDLINFSTQ